MHPIVLILLVLAPSAQAFESRFQINRALELAKLEKTGKIEVHLEKVKSVYYADASAVVKADPAKLLELSMDYNRYVEFGMPNVLESATIATEGADRIYSWTHMSTAGVGSKHFTEVRVERNLGNGATGLQWQLTPRRSGWTRAEDPAFDRLDGSWYVEPLTNGRVYIRYFLAADLSTSLPSFIVDGIAKREFKIGIERIIQILARKAATRP